MRLLLDTNVFLWANQSPKRLGRTADDLLDPASDLLVSAVVAWEIAIKYALGRLPLPDPPAIYLPTRMQALGARRTAISHDDALGVASLPALHGDPFDRLLVAQALALDATLVTGDATLADYPCRTLLV